LDLREFYAEMQHLSYTSHGVVPQ